MIKNILGIDQSYTSTGICILDETRKIIFSKVITTNKINDIYTRAGEIINNIIPIIQQYKPEQIAIEGLAFGMRGNATRDLAGLQFVIIHEIKKLDYQYKVISPLTIKKLAMSSLNDKSIKMKDMKKKMMHQATPNKVKEHLETQKFLKTKGLYDVVDAYWLSRSLL